MRITRLKIQNFKAIREFEINELSDAVVIAGPNGSGKSCIFDAIRLLKSLYGGYNQEEEWHHFFNEFQLNLNNPDEIKRIFSDPSRDILIEADFEISPSELEFVRENAKTLIEKSLLQQRFGRKHRRLDFSQTVMDNDQQKEIDKYSEAIVAATAQRIQTARFQLSPSLSFRTDSNVLLEFVFGVYDPKNIGVIDFHSPNRTYQRERIGGININIEDASNRMAQHSLYNWQNKYQNIKSELAAAFVRDLLANEAGATRREGVSIVETLRDLFSTFLPGKRFGGPRPGIQGEVSFPIEIDSGGEHDIDDLSSGEKELVYGYLRLRNTSPSNSIILLDEPELHLNPRIIVGLPSFYRKNLGSDLNNQIWMVTHSDAFLRDAFKSGGFSLYHMTPLSLSAEGENQAVSVSSTNEVDRAVIEMVGDLAGYRPGSKIVLFESSESANFDASLTKRLFPDFADKTNTISGDDKYSVQQLYVALEKAIPKMNLPAKVYAIVDRDAESLSRRSDTARVYTWDAYHIENYLLEPRFISKVLSDSPSYASPMSETEVENALEEVAEETLGALLNHRLTAYANEIIRQNFDLRTNRRADDMPKELSGAIERLHARIGGKLSQELSLEKLMEMKAEWEAELTAALRNGTWRKEFKGRDILRRFAGKFTRGLPYEAFRDAILARMADANFRPRGMENVVEKILADKI